MTISDAAIEAATAKLVEVLARRDPMTRHHLYFSDVAESLQAALAVMERENATPPPDAEVSATDPTLKGYDLTLHNTIEFLQSEVTRLSAAVREKDEALRRIASMGPVFDAKGTHSERVTEIARAALSDGGK
jgi:hypothetical protein